MHHHFPSAVSNISDPDVNCATSGEGASTDSATTPTSIRKGWIVTSFVLGATAVSAAIFTEAVWQWQGIWPSVLLELGAATGLAGILFLLERLFVRETVERTRQVVSRVEERTLALEDQVSNQETRLDELAAAADDVAERRYKSQDEVLEAVRTKLTFDTVANALETAGATGGLHPLFRVRASDNVAGLRMSLRRVSLEPPLGESRRALMASFRTLSDDPAPGQLVWNEDVPSPEFADHLREQVERANVAPGRFDAQVAFNELADSIELVVRSRRGDLPRLAGKLIERLTQDIVLTDAGVESLSAGVLVRADDFPPQASSKERQMREPEFQPPPPPTGVAPEEWHGIIEVARWTYPLPATAVMIAGLQ